MLDAYLQNTSTREEFINDSIENDVITKQAGHTTRELSSIKFNLPTKSHYDVAGICWMAAQLSFLKIPVVVGHISFDKLEKD